MLAQRGPSLEGTGGLGRCGASAGKGTGGQAGSGTHTPISKPAPLGFREEISMVSPDSSLVFVLISGDPFSFLLFFSITCAAWGGRIMRRRQCRHCGKRMTTWERPSG